MKKILAFLLSIVIALSLVACNSKTKDINCSKCGELISSSASFCSSCGTALNIAETTAENKEPTTSSTSSTTDSVPETTATSTTQPPHSHSYGEATCTTPAKCACGATSGSALGHSYSNGKCSRCDAADPNYVAHTHSYGNATCTTPAKCSCGATSGSALGHSYSNGKCSRCGSSDPNYNPISISKQNALKKAKSYLNYSAFSKQGLIEQLEYEKFSHEDAVYGVDNCGANWNEQVLKKQNHT